MAREIKEEHTLSMEQSGSSSKLSSIEEPGPHDVLCGRGAKIASFPGNKLWRELVKARREEYVSMHKLKRWTLTQSIVDNVRALDPPGRFLRQDPSTGLWFDIGDQKAQESKRITHRLFSL